jgi:hypothetical protein
MLDNDNNVERGGRRGRQGVDKEDEGQRGQRETARTTGDGENDDEEEDKGNDRANPAPGSHGWFPVLTATPGLMTTTTRRGLFLFSLHFYFTDQAF